MKARKSWQDYGREWLDTLVVAISVAMAFRAYFYEPFNIPTGSMRPTLYGNYTVAATPKDKTAMDLPVLSFFKAVGTGETFKEFRAPWSGQVTFAARKDGCFDMLVRNSMHHPEKHLMNKFLRFFREWIASTFAENEYDNSIGMAKIPTDAYEECKHLQGLLVAKGDLLWCGRVRKGDFIFVNRWTWNFHKPTRGDVMIFSTTGVGESPAGQHVGADGKRYNLQQGTHYIKRMTALPNETIEIKNPDVYINGEKIPLLKPAVGASGEMSPPPDAGPMTGPFKLGPDEYFACGDNSFPIKMSEDSRYWGPVPGDKLRGVASCVFWPIINPRFGRIK